MDVDLEPRFFAVLDKRARQGDGEEAHTEPMVVLCRIGDESKRGDSVHCVLRPAKEAALTLAGLEYRNFRQLLEGGEYVPDLGS